MASNTVTDSQSPELFEEDSVPFDEEYLLELEELAKNRYTDDDEEYQKIKSMPKSTPPTLEGYPPRNQDRDSNRYQNRRPYRGGNERYRRNEQPRYHGSQSHGSQSYGSHSSSNSYHNRPRYNPYGRNN